MTDFTGKRHAIAAALQAVPDVTGHAFRPSTPAIGDAWPVLAPLTRSGAKQGGGDAFVVTWHVRVLLPQEEEAASTFLDEHWDALFYALKPLGYIQQAAPTMLATGAGDMYAFQITMIAEE